MNLLLFNLRTDADDDVLGFTTDWVNGLAVHFERVFVVTMMAGRQALAPNVTLFSVGKEKGHSEPRRAIAFYRHLLGLLATERIDVCFAHMMPVFAAMAGPVLRLRGIPMVLWYTHKSLTPDLRVAAAFADRIVTAGPETFPLPGPKVRVIGHGVDSTRFTPVPREASSTFEVLSIGRLAPVKRLEVAIEALALVKARWPDRPIRLTLVGGPLSEADRAYADRLRELVAAEGLDASVRFAGSVPFRAVAEYHQAADCFVNMAETGGVDKAVLEAMSCGVPVVVNPIFSDVLGPDLAAAWVVSREAEHLAERLVALMAMTADARAALGRDLRAIVQRDHDLNGLCGRLTGELRGLAATKGTRS